MVLKAIKARIYPNQTQRKQLLVNFGCVRFVWNQMLNMQIERHKNNKDAKYQNHFAMNNMVNSPQSKDMGLVSVQAFRLY